MNPNVRMPPPRPVIRTDVPFPPFPIPQKQPQIFIKPSFQPQQKIPQLPQFRQPPPQILNQPRTLHQPPILQPPQQQILPQPKQPMLQPPLIPQPQPLHPPQPRPQLQLKPQQPHQVFDIKLYELTN